MRHEFFIPMARLPTTTHQEKDITFVMKDGKPKPIVYEPAELKAVRVKLRDYLAKHIPDKTFTGPLRLITKWCFPITGKHTNGEYKTTKPDCSNTIKMLEDVMTDLGFWKDDALVASLIVEKFWADLPGIYICIEEIGVD